VHTGVTQSSSSLAPSGDVIVKGSDINGGTADAGGASNEITFYITNTAGGTPVDLDKVVITYTDDENFISRAYTENGGYVDGLQTPPDRGTLGPHNPSAFDGAAWAKTTGWNYFNVLPTGTNDNLISSGEKYKVIIYLPEFIDHANPDDVVLPVVNEKFKIEVKPPEGAVLSITKTLPAALAKGSYYQVY
jgi:flagellin FlaB